MEQNFCSASTMTRTVVFIVNEIRLK